MKFFELSRWIIASALVAGLAVPAGVPAARAAAVESALAAVIAAAPAQSVSVIVQKAGPGAAVEARIAALGGVVTRDLTLINAVVARLSGQSVLELSRDPAVRWVSLDAPTIATGVSTEVSYTTWASSLGTVTANTFGDAALAVSSQLGPDASFASGARNGLLSVGGFAGQVTDGHQISRVEVVMRGYMPVKAEGTARLIASLGGVAGKPKDLNLNAFKGHDNPATSGEAVIDITGTRTWQWSDFNGDLQLAIDLAKGKDGRTLMLDSVGLRVTSKPGPDASADQAPTDLPRVAVDTSCLINVYNRAVRATDVWNQAPAFLQGQGLTVAVVDSGSIKNRDYDGRVIVNRNFTSGQRNSADAYGHGTFVSAIVAGSGDHSRGQYIGIAPKVNLANVRVSNDQGMSTEADVVAALQWVFENRARFNIRVVNLSLNSSVAQSYHTSPLSAAVEVLWFNGVVVVVSAGNNGTGVLYPPANDPFVITVGAVDDRGTVSLTDDTVAAFSAYGLTETGQVKPDLVAPGVNFIAPVPNSNHMGMGRAHPGNIVDKGYFRMSGTSMAAPVVSGAVALLLQDEPTLTPDQVKFRLMATANANWPGYEPARAGAGYLDVYAAVNGMSTQAANSGLTASQMLWTGDQPVAWGSVSWNSVSWNSVSWNSVSWNSVSWNSDYWGP
jgi:serine protease AprX